MRSGFLALMGGSILVSSILASSILCAVALPAKAEPVRKVIELFTSQGCNSCPPADRLAAQMAREPGTVVISLPVDYWDYLGWKDSFASPVFTARQRAYSKARGDMQIYTPQAVIDGIAHAVGSERDAIEAAAAASRAPEVAITDTLNGDQLRIDVAAGPDAGKQAKVWLVPILSAASVAISRGENAGATVTYTNVARELRKLGDWDGGARKFDVSAAELRKLGADSAAVLLQADSGGLPGRILGAAIVKLK
ncbi:hypothetical protein SAMN05444161_0752 [Rhizobiales bacterium GAS191]|nr:hypothetical protein SAMN05444161_0752 [Rhizobiales bacterium GAS191]